jgi:hypothetical protein
MIDCETKHCTAIIGNGTAGNVGGLFSGHVTLPNRRSNSPSQTEPPQLALVMSSNFDHEHTYLFEFDLNRITEYPLFHFYRSVE